jgi:hypothetical protein
MPTELPDCTPFCEAFQCMQRPPALKKQRKGNKTEAWCTAFSDVCDGAWCQFSNCSAKGMTVGGKCKGRPSGSPAGEEVDDIPFEEPGYIPKKYAKKVRTKAS